MMTSQLPQTIRAIDSKELPEQYNNHEHTTSQCMQFRVHGGSFEGTKHKYACGSVGGLCIYSASISMRMVAPPAT